MFSSKTIQNRSLIELQIQKKFLQKSNTLFLHFIVTYFRKIQFLSSYFYSIFSKQKKKRKRKNKVPPILFVFSSLFQASKMPRKEKEKIRNMHFVGRFVQIFGRPIWLPDRCPKRHFRFLVSRFLGYLWSSKASHRATHLKWKGTMHLNGDDSRRKSPSWVACTLVRGIRLRNNPA